MDFSDFKPPTERTLVTCRCDKCGEQDDYLADLGGHLHAVTRALKKCNGRLVEVSRRTEPL